MGFSFSIRYNEQTLKRKYGVVFSFQNYCLCPNLSRFIEWRVTGFAHVPREYE